MISRAELEEILRITEETKRSPHWERVAELVRELLRRSPAPTAAPPVELPPKVAGAPIGAGGLGVDSGDGRE